MDTIFKNFKNSKISEPYRLTITLSDKINLKGSDSLLYQTLACTKQREIDKPEASKPREANKKFKNVFRVVNFFYTMKNHVHTDADTFYIFLFQKNIYIVHDHIFALWVFLVLNDFFIYYISYRCYIFRYVKPEPLKFPELLQKTIFLTFFQKM